MTCPHCGYNVPDTDRFCSNCGSAMIRIPSAPQPYPSQTPESLEYAPTMPVRKIHTND